MQTNVKLFCGEQENRTLTTFTWTYLAGKLNKPVFDYSPLEPHVVLETTSPAYKAGASPYMLMRH